MWGKRESLNANDNDLISVSLKIILAPSSGKEMVGAGSGVADIAEKAPTSPQIDL